MSADLFWLVCTAVLGLCIAPIYLVGEMQTPGGLQWGLGNRDTPLPLPGYAERAKRAHANFTENIGPFAVLVLVANVAGKSGDTTALGAAIFFWSRLAHVVTYTAGIVGLRTVVFFAGVVGEVMILTALLG